MGIFQTYLNLPRSQRLKLGMGTREVYVFILCANACGAAGVGVALAGILVDAKLAEWDGTKERELKEQQAKEEAKRAAEQVQRE